MIKDYALGNCRNLTAPDIIFMRFQIYQQIRYEHLLLRYDEIYTMSDKTPYIIGRHCTQYKYYRALGFSLNQFFLFPHLPRSICRTVCTIQKNYVMPQQVSRTKCITGSNIGWECMQDILFDRPDVRPQIKQFSDVPACHIYKIIYFAHNHLCLRICKINDYILYIKEIYEIYSAKFPLKTDLGISGAKKFFV